MHRRSVFVQTLLLSLTLALPGGVQAAIYKCADAITGNTIYSSNPCDGANQRPLGVLQASDLQERDSTFDGASLKRRAEALERQKRSEPQAPASGAAAQPAKGPKPAGTPPAVRSETPAPVIVEPPPAAAPAPAPAVQAMPADAEDMIGQRAKIRIQPLARPAGDAAPSAPQPAGKRQQPPARKAAAPAAPAAAGADDNDGQQQTIRFSPVVRPADSDETPAAPVAAAPAARAAAPEKPAETPSAAPVASAQSDAPAAAPARRFAHYCAALLQERNNLRVRLQESGNEEEAAWVRRQMRDLADKLKQHECY